MAKNIIEWLQERVEAAHRDSEAHPKGSNNRAFYHAQALAYENALSAALDRGSGGVKASTAGVVVVSNPLREALTAVRDRILAPDYGGIDDTFWMTPTETVVDFINNALDAPEAPPPAGADGGGSGDLGALSAGARLTREQLAKTAYDVLSGGDPAPRLELAAWEIADAILASAPTPDLGAQDDPLSWADLAGPPDPPSKIAAEIMCLRWTRGGNDEEHCNRYGQLQEIIAKHLALSFKPAAWIYEWADVKGEWRKSVKQTDPTGCYTNGTRNVEPLFRMVGPPQTIDDNNPVEVARRKALRKVMSILEDYPWACDTAKPIGTKDTATYGMYRDLVGQPRRYPDRHIDGYD